MTSLHRTVLLTDPHDCRDLLERLCGTPDRAPEIKGILDLLELKYQVDMFAERDEEFCNFYLPPRYGGNLWLMAHHDVCNRASQNANDNTASVINAILLHLDNPGVGVALTDGEEPPTMGAGSRRFATMMQDRAPRVINLELTGIGGWETTGQDEAGTQTLLHRHFAGRGMSSCYTPFNDASVLRRAGIDATCLFSCYNPLTGSLDGEKMGRMHNAKDRLDTLDFGPDV